ncbi:MAG: hypothetical protein ABI652_07195, partial [Acidobacteriota bacterium]
WLLAASAAAVCFGTVAFGTIAPLQGAGAIDFLFVWPQPGIRTLVWVIAALLPVALFAGVRWAASRQADSAAPVGSGAAGAGPSRRSVAAAVESGAWLAPLSALAVVALGVAPAFRGVGDRGAVLGYFFYDLRWWWLLLLGGWTVLRADRLIGEPLARRLRSLTTLREPARLLLFDGVLFAGVIAWALTTSPLVRFTDVFTGDEPKYLRYCELWYQGGGLDVSAKSTFVEQPLDAAPRVLHNLAMLGPALRDDAVALVQDIRHFASQPMTFRWNRAHSESGFVTGKNGGVYQVHQPGLSAVMFPAYFIDRYLLATQPSATGEFPRELAMTNLSMLLIYGGCAVALFRLLRQALGSEPLAWLWAAFATMTLPTAAFAFQIYPELPVLLMLLILINYVWFSPAATRSTDGTRSGLIRAGGDRQRVTRYGLLAPSLAGASTGALAWFHPRFLLISMVLAIVGLARLPMREKVAFASAWIAVLTSVGLFNYHVTGSWLPNALWDANGGGIELWTAGFLQNLLGYGLDRTWGLLPHSLLLVAVIPGFVVLARESPRWAAFIGAIVLALLVPSAGHTLSAAGTTPDRLIVAVSPLLIIPIAAVTRRFWCSGIARAAVVVGAVLSMEAALAYNGSFDKSFGAMKDVSAIGWRPNLAFPILRGDVWTTSEPNFVLFLTMSTLLIVVGALAFRSPSTRSTPRRQVVACSVVVVCLVAGFSVATSANGDWTSDHYVIDRSAARRMAAAALVAQDSCRLCFSTTQPAMNWTRLKPNPALGPHVAISTVGLAATIAVAVDGDDDTPGFGRLKVDFGDGQSTGWIGIVGATTATHTYRQTGDYGVVAWLQLSNGAVKFERSMANVHEVQ